MNAPNPYNMPLERDAPLEQSLDTRWEMDVEPWLNSIFNTLVGFSLQDGVWKRDYTITRTMNELGASVFIRELKSRVSIHMQFSSLHEKDIIEISSLASENYGDLLEDHWELWEIEPTESNFRSIAMSLYDSVSICLRIAENGGMKQHRERRRGHVDPPQMPEPPMV